MAPKLGRAPRVLLSGVFGPFGVDDEFGRKENLMELFHNQVTKAQGTASFRFHHRSFGLYFLAANVDAEVTVLDFPSRERFVQELGRGYDFVGISFIAPNFGKAREMVRLTRLHAPAAKIVLGGHGTAIEGIEELVDCDHVIRGEGIRGLRALLGQDPDAPIVHPVLPSAERESILGVPVFDRPASLLVPGVGCVNGCRFCCTSHFFDKRYTPFLASGQELFETARQIAGERGTDDFFVMDENFLKDRRRALELLELMERHHRYFGFQIFSSAEAILAFGLDNLVRLGVSFLWIGVESSAPYGEPKANGREHGPEIGGTANYAKNSGVDARNLVRELRDRGISVLASGIVCAEHHTPDNVDDELDFMVSLEADMLQLMLLTPMPTTTLYRSLERQGLLRTDLPLEEWHGQKEMTWRHPAFPGDAPRRVLERGFRLDYEVNGSSMYRVVETAFRGWQRLAAMPRRDACLEHRMRALGQRARNWSTMLAELAANGVNERERERARELDREIATGLGRPGVKGSLLRAAARVLAATWRQRVRLFGDSIQPRTIVTRFATSGGARSGVPVVPVPAPVAIKERLTAAAAFAPALSCVAAGQILPAWPAGSQPAPVSSDAASA